MDTGQRQRGATIVSALFHTREPAACCGGSRIANSAVNWHWAPVRTLDATRVTAMGSDFRLARDPRTIRKQAGQFSKKLVWRNEPSSALQYSFFIDRNVDT